MRENGYHPVPVNPGEKRCLITEWQSRAVTDNEAMWQTATVKHNVGIVCADIICTADFDNHGPEPNGATVFMRIMKDYVDPFKGCIVEMTPTGGYHVSYRSSRGEKTYGRYLVDGVVLDIEIHGGPHYTVCAPSRTKDGEYVPIGNATYDNTPLASLTEEPDVFKIAIEWYERDIIAAKKQAYEGMSDSDRSEDLNELDEHDLEVSADHYVQRFLQGATEGHRHDRAVGLVGALMGLGLPERDIRNHMRHYAGRLDRVMTEREIDGAIEWASRRKVETRIPWKAVWEARERRDPVKYGKPMFTDSRGNPIKVDPDKLQQVVKQSDVEPTQEVKEEVPVKEKITRKFPLTDTGNAERLCYYYGEDLHYCPEWNKWLVWDGRRWKPDDAKFTRINEIAKNAVRKIILEQEMAAGEEEEKKIKGWAKASESAMARASMIKLAQSEPGVPVHPEDMDAKPWLFPVLNGSIDLKTGKIKDFDRADLITKLSKITYVKAAEHPVLDGFLQKNLRGNEKLIKYVRRMVGSCMVGARAECIFVFYGGTKTGKSRFVEMVHRFMGDYAQVIPDKTLFVKKYGGEIPNDIAKLKGCRVATMSETNEGEWINEALIKKATGGDCFSARFLHGEFFDFTPEFKILLATNHRPNVKGSPNDAIWNRIHIIPMNVFIPEKERDPDLVDKVEAEFSGFLNWALEGCLEWQRIGLCPPEEVQAAVESYKADMDVLAQFFDERCNIAPEQRVKPPTLWNEYLSYCSEKRQRPYSERTFFKKLEEDGRFEKIKSGTSYWRGIGLKFVRDEESPAAAKKDTIQSFGNDAKPVEEDKSEMVKRHAVIKEIIREQSKYTGVNASPLPAIADAMKGKGYPESKIEGDLKFLKEIGEVMEVANKPGFYEVT